MPLHRSGINMNAAPGAQPPIGTPAPSSPAVPPRPASHQPGRSNTLGAGIGSPAQLGSSITPFLPPLAPGAVQHPLSGLDKATDPLGYEPHVRDYGVGTIGQLRGVFAGGSVGSLGQFGSALPSSSNVRSGPAGQLYSNGLPASGGLNTRPSGAVRSVYGPIRARASTTSNIRSLDQGRVNNFVGSSALRPGNTNIDSSPWTPLVRTPLTHIPYINSPLNPSAAHQSFTQAAPLSNDESSASTSTISLPAPHTWRSSALQHEREWKRISTNLLAMRLDRSPSLPTTLPEYLEHKRSLLDILTNEEKDRVAAAVEEFRTNRRLGIRTPLVPFSGRVWSDGRRGVLGHETIWAKHWTPDENHEAANWPAEEEFKEEGDERNTSGFGRFLPLPRVPGNPTVVYKQKPFIEAYPFDKIDHVAKMWNVTLPKIGWDHEIRLDGKCRPLDDYEEEGWECFTEGAEGNWIIEGLGASKMEQLCEVDEERKAVNARDKIRLERRGVVFFDWDAYDREISRRQEIQTMVAQQGGAPAQFSQSAPFLQQGGLGRGSDTGMMGSRSHESSVPTLNPYAPAFHPTFNLAASGTTLASNAIAVPSTGRQTIYNPQAPTFIPGGLRVGQEDGHRETSAEESITTVQGNPTRDSTAAEFDALAAEMNIMLLEREE